MNDYFSFLQLVRSFFMGLQYTKIVQNLFFVSLLLVIVSLPYSIEFNSISSISLLFFFILNLFTLKRASFRLESFLMFLCFVLCYIIQVVGFFYTNDDIKDGIHQMEVKLMMLLSPIIFYILPVRQRHYQIFLTVFIVSCISVTIRPVYQIIQIYLLKGEITTLEIEKILPFHRPFLGMYMVLSACFAIYLSGNTTKLWQKIILVLVSIYFCFCTVIIIAKTSILLLGFFLFLITLYLFSNYLFYRFLLIIPVIIFGVVIYIFADIEKNRSVKNFSWDGYAKFSINNLDENIDYGYKMRMVLWRCSYDSWTANRQTFLIGYGTGDIYASINNCLKKEKEIYLSAFRFHPHNEYLVEALRHGLIGLLLFLTSLLYPYYLAIRYKNNLYIFFLLIFILFGLSDTLFSAQKTTVLYAIFNSLMAFQMLKIREKSLDTKA